MHQNRAIVIQAPPEYLLLCVKETTVVVHARDYRLAFSTHFPHAEHLRKDVNQKDDVTTVEHMRSCMPKTRTLNRQGQVQCI